MKHIFKIISITVLLSSLSSCGNKTIQSVTTLTPLLIETKAQIKSPTESRNVKIDIALSPNRAIRLEVTAILGYRVATVLMTPQKIQYALHTNQTYFEGPFNARSMYPIFKQALDPRIIWRIIHGLSPQSAQLICQTDLNQKPILCTGPDSLMIKWTYEEAPKKRIQIKNSQFEMNWIFKDQTLLNESQTETFVLKKPDGYKEIVLK
jgi:hypothetical protein